MDYQDNPEESMSDFYEAWNYLEDLADKRKTCPENCLDIQIVKVNPATEEIDDNDQLNTETRVWLEFGWPEYEESLNLMVSTHNYEWDCGAPTFEEAIIELARLVKKDQK